jgi:hypothetical protein
MRRKWWRTSTPKIGNCISAKTTSSGTGGCGTAASDFESPGNYYFFASGKTYDWVFLGVFRGVLNLFDPLEKP